MKLNFMSLIKSLYIHFSKSLIVLVSSDKIWLYNFQTNEVENVNNYIDILKTSTGLKITPKGFSNSFVSTRRKLKVTVNGGKNLAGIIL